MQANPPPDQRHLRVPDDRRRPGEPPPIQVQQAVVVGVGAYAPPIRPLANAPEDARSVAALLAADYGFDLLPDGTALLEEQAGRAAVQAHVEASLAAAGPNTRWLFYFAGHGLVLEGQGYLLPADAAQDDLQSYLAVSWLIERCIDSACGEALIVLDACYAGRALVRPEFLTDLIPDDGSAGKVRQLITAGNPDQPVLDGGGSGHSVFTQALLEALEGWAGIHEPEEDGQSLIRFTPMLDHLVFEIPARLRSQGLGAMSQQPIGGNLVGHALRRDFTFRCSVPRLNPETVRGARSNDPGRRMQDLARLAEDYRSMPELREPAVRLAQLHLDRTPRAGNAMLVTSTLRYEPDPAVRSQAARTLATLGDPLAAGTLVEALADEPAVCRAAAGALGQLGVKDAAAPLLERLQEGEDHLLLDLVDAIGAIGDPDTSVAALRESLRRGLLVPFVGPDFPQALTGLPDRAAVAAQLAERYGLPDSDSLAEAAAGTVGGGGSRHSFTAFLRRQLDDQLLQPGPIHQALAQLPISFWISGAYDGLLAKALNANAVVSGGDTQYWLEGRPTVVQLVGSLTQVANLVVLPEDFQVLRRQEGDRQLLTSWIWKELQGKVILFLGFDPDSPDFALLAETILNKHLTGVDCRSLLVWPEAGQVHRWQAHTIHPLHHAPLDLLQHLAAA